MPKSIFTTCFSPPTGRKLALRRPGECLSLHIAGVHQQQCGRRREGGRAARAQSLLYGRSYPPWSFTSLLLPLRRTEVCEVSGQEVQAQGPLTERIGKGKGKEGRELLPAIPTFFWKETGEREKPPLLKKMREKVSDGRFGIAGVQGGQGIFLNQSPSLPPKRKISLQQEQKDE